MFVTPQGKIAYNTIGELNYNLFMTIGLAINADQHLYDQDTMKELNFNGKYIKASINDIPVYAGRNDVVFEPSRNYKLMATLFGYYIDKETNSEEGDKVGFISQGNEDSKDREFHRLFVDTKRYGRVESDWYQNGYLGFIDCIFKLDGQNIDLHNFDIREER